MKLSRLFIVALTVVFLVQSAMAAFTSNKNDDNKNKYSLKHLTRLSNNYMSFQLRYRSAQTAGNYPYTRDANGLSVTPQVNTYLFSQKTTTTFVYPYKYTAKVPKFKTPTRPQQ